MRVTAVATAICFSLVSLSLAQEVRAAIRKPTYIPAQPLEPALQALAKVCDLQVVYRTEVVSEQQSNGIAGDVTADEALRGMLSGTGLTYRYLDANTVTIVSEAGQDPASAEDAPPRTAPQTQSSLPETNGAIELQEVTVTGSRIK